jgi:type II secretory pathway pseudopilin PulG
MLELLVVIGVISVLVVAIVPAVTSLSKSNGRKAAVGNVLGAIEQARSAAIKDGQATYLVFPTFTGAPSSPTDRYNYKSYAVFEDDPANPGSVKQLTQWRTLPTGVSFRKPTLDYLVTSISFAFTPSGSTGTFPFLKFDTAGAIDPTSTKTQAGTSVQFTVFEGYVSNSNEVFTSPKDSSGNPTAVEQLFVSRATGRAQYTP